jgi:uncharacterized protein YbjT (DUF2867 family)
MLVILMVRALVTGASGYVGSRLVSELHALGVPVGCVARDPSRVAVDAAVTVHRGDMLDADSLRAIGDGYTTAYYLVHSMGRERWCRASPPDRRRGKIAAWNVCLESVDTSCGPPTRRP